MYIYLVYIFVFSSKNVVCNSVLFILGAVPRKFNKPGVYPCTVCGKVYKWQPSLSKHKHKCNKTMVYKCYICYYTCLSSNQLTQHHQMNHMRNRLR